MVSPLTRNVRTDRYGNDGSAVRQVTLALADHRYNPHATCRVSLIALKKINLSSCRPGIGKSQVCVCGTRRSRFRKTCAINVCYPVDALSTISIELHFVHFVMTALAP